MGQNLTTLKVRRRGGEERDKQTGRFPWEALTPERAAWQMVSRQQGLRMAPLEVQFRQHGRGVTEQLAYQGSCCRTAQWQGF